MQKPFTARRVVLLALATAPLAVVQIGFAWSLGPLARAGARFFGDVARDLPRGASADPVETPPEAPLDAREVKPEEESAVPSEGVSAPSAARRRPPNGRPPVLAAGVLKLADRSPAARRERVSVFVGPDSIQRAIPAANRPTSIWTERTPQHPAGLLIQSPGVLRGTIEAGDILVEAEGQALGSFEQLITTVKQAYERRAKRLSGRIFRHGDFVPVTVEPGWQ